MSSVPPLVPARLARLFDEAARDRLVLLLNHILGSEAVATERLRPHAQHSVTVRVRGWPQLPGGLLPAPDPLVLRITRAGLLERVEAEEHEGHRSSAAGAAATGSDAGSPQGLPTDLVVEVDASDPLALIRAVAAGRTPALSLAGDARLAADVGWLAENLRWDVAADLERVFGPLSAEKLHQWSLAVGQGLREALSRMAARRGPG